LSSYIYKNRAQNFWNENSDYLSNIKNLIPVKRISVTKDVVIIARFLLKDSTNFINRIVMNSGGELRNLETLTIIRS
jgi:hypothetical protein